MYMYNYYNIFINMINRVELEEANTVFDKVQVVKLLIDGWIELMQYMDEWMDHIIAGLGSITLFNYNYTINYPCSITIIFF